MPVSASSPPQEHSAFVSQKKVLELNGSASIRSMFVYVKIPTDPQPLRFGPQRHGKLFGNALVVFSNEGQAIVTFTEYEYFWEEPDENNPAPAVLG